MNVLEAPDCPTALRLFAVAHPPIALVVLDVTMPVVNGVETLRRLRAAGAACPVIMLTSQATRLAVEECFLAGADHYLRKDSPREEIAECIRACLGESTQKKCPAPARDERPATP